MTREQEYTLDALCLRYGGWLAIEGNSSGPDVFAQPAKALGGPITVHEDGSYTDDRDILHDCPWPK